MRPSQIGIAAILSAAMASAASSPALAQQNPDYWFIGGDKTVLDYFDMASLVSDGDVKRGWLWWYYSGVAPKFAGMHVRALAEQNCRTRQYRSLELTVYKTDGTESSSHVPGNWRDVVPGSNGDMDLGFICSGDEMRSSVGERLPVGMAPDEHAKQNFEFLNPSSDSIIAGALAGTALPVTPGDDDSPP